MSLLVSGTQNRIFLNTSIGCDCMCRYCYLPDIGVVGVEYFGHQKVFDELISLPYYKPGPMGSVLSIGCYSECFSPENRQETLSLIKKVAPLGNHIQLATKRRISESDLLRLDRFAQYKNQIGIYVSVPTLSRSSEIESGTDGAYKRLEMLKYQQLLHNISFVLYIKPVLPGITVKDIPGYRHILETYRIKCVVGGLLHPHQEKEAGTIRVGQSWFMETDDEQGCIIAALRPYADIYKHSVDIVKEYIEQEGN